MYKNIIAYVCRHILELYASVYFVSEAESKRKPESRELLIFNSRTPVIGSKKIFNHSTMIKQPFCIGVVHRGACISTHGSCHTMAQKSASDYL